MKRILGHERRAALLLKCATTCFSGEEGHTIALHVVVPALQQASDIRKFIEVPCKRVADEFLPASALFCLRAGRASLGRLG